MRKIPLFGILIMALVLAACGAAPTPTPAPTLAPAAPITTPTATAKVVKSPTATKRPAMTVTRAATIARPSTPMRSPVAGGTTFTAQLSGNNAVTPISTNASGMATFTLSSDGTTMTYKLTVTDLNDVTMAHIHIGGPGQEGPIAVWLFPPKATEVTPIAGTLNGTLAEGSFTAADFVGPLQGKTMADLISQIKADNAYVNVHTKLYPNGEIRGQIK